MSDILEIDRCQLCGSKNLTTYLDFGLSPLANSLKTTAGEIEFQAPLEVVKCENKECQCFQLRHQVNPDILFGNFYSYRSSNGLQKHFEEYAKHTVELLNLQKNSLVIGIGGNIGQLEKAYNNLGLIAVNVEPAKNIAEESVRNGVYTVNSFFDKSIKISGLKAKAKLITGNNVFGHCNLHPIMEGVKELLDKDGYLILECAYWLKTIQNRDAFQIYSEHVLYQHVTGLKNFFDSYGFDLFRCEFNEIQCGTVRAYVKRKENTKFEIDKSVEEAIKNEEEFGLFKKETYLELMEDLDYRGIAIRNKLLEIVKDGGKIGLFGVAAKTVLMIKYFDIADEITLATDDSDLKHQKFIPGTSIKITNKEEFWAQKPDYVIPIWNFFSDIIKVNKDKNCKWLRILPKLEIV